MAWKYEIELGDLVETIVDYEPIREIVWTKIYAKELAIKQSEYYNGIAAGRKPELVFEIRSCEFNNHEKVRVDGKIYDIVRYYKKGDMTEIVIAAGVV